MSKGKRKPTYKDKRRSAAPGKEEDVKKCGLNNRGSRKTGNDPTWYTRSGQLTKDAFSQPFTWPTGRTLPIDYKKCLKGTSSATAVNNYVPSVPGIMSIQLALFPGKAKDENAPINVAARNLYSYVRHANSGHSNYDAPDLMLYLMAMDSLYSMFEWGKRCYGTLALASTTNRYYPRALVSAQGFDYDDMLQHIVDLRAFLNVAAIKLSSLCVPKSMSIFARHQMLFSEVYRDSDDPKSQLYLYTPAHFYKFIETEGAGKLQGGYPDYAAGATTFYAYERGLTERMNAVLSSEDMNIMSGDILKAFGEGNLLTVQQIPENYAVVPRYDEGVLYQMRNATLAGAKPSEGIESWDVTQDVNTGALLCDPIFASGINAAVPGFERIISAPVAYPSNDFIAEATRLTVMGDTSTASDGSVNLSYKLHDFASDVALNAWVWYYGPTGTLVHSTMYGTLFLASGKADLSDLRVTNTFSQFKHHPDCTVLSGTTSTLGVWGHYFEFDNYTVVGEADISNMHEAALLSMYNIPEYGAWDVGVGSSR